jgi:hypothetical protein
MSPNAVHTSLVIAAGLLLQASTIASADPKPAALDCQLGFDRLKQTISTSPSALVSEKGDWDMVQVNSTGAGESNWWIALYVFTKRPHYAYPTVTRKLMWKEPDGQVISERTACGYGDKALFDKVMAEFADLDRQMVDAIKKEHQEKPKQ